jgi:uracil-DNA glycosylase family 4
VKPDGPIPARLMIVGEAPGEEEVRRNTPFQGNSGIELNSMLHDAGLHRSTALVTNVCRLRPPQNDISKWMARKPLPLHVEWRGRWVLPPIAEGAALLEQEIALCKPEVILALGNTALLALTGREGIGDWRGSLLQHSSGAFVIPTWHPAYILRMWDHRVQAVHDMRRAASILEKGVPPAPAWKFTIRPTFEEVVMRLWWLLNRADEGRATPLWIDFDLETRAGHIACAGLSWSLTEALCIPFMSVEDEEGYWNSYREWQIVKLLRELLMHRRVKVRGQNLLYDCQYTARHWLFVPNVAQDTMIAWHTCFPGLRKALDFQASMLCDFYVYWKMDGRLWDGSVPEDELWQYNCVDCVRTREVGEESARIIEKMGLQEVDAFQQRLFWPVLYAMQRGVRIDLQSRAALAKELEQEVDERFNWFVQVLGHSLNPSSYPQMKSFFIDDLQQEANNKLRKDGFSTASFDDESLEKMLGREPLLEPVVRKIQELRSIRVYLSTFVKMPLDQDERMRCSFNLCGTETYRFSSSENAFGTGGNLQNLPHGDDVRRLPNIRKLFLPDPGHTFFEVDGKGADFQVVIAEVNDDNLRQAVAEIDDLHTHHMKELRLPARQLTKRFTHATNYGGKPGGMSLKLGLTKRVIEDAQKRYFEMYPGIKQWHERVEAQVRETRTVSNAFGYRRYYFDRLDSILPEALAWVPQSTVACFINRVWVALWEEFGPGGDLEVLLQVHDSLAGQFSTAKSAEILSTIQRIAATITVPYPTPLVIPVSIATSPVSWGACAK